jgi:uncharacterized membrane protein
VTIGLGLGLFLGWALVSALALSRVSVDADSPLWPLAFQGRGEDARGILVVVSATMITVTGLVFALTIVALQIASGQYSPPLLRNFMGGSAGPAERHGEELGPASRSPCWPAPGCA